MAGDSSWCKMSTATRGLDPRSAAARKTGAEDEVHD